MNQAAAHWLCHEGISAERLRVVYQGRPASIDATKVAALRAEGLGATEIAKRLKIGRASVYRLLLRRRGWGRLNEREIATPRGGRWQRSSGRGPARHNDQRREGESSGGQSDDRMQAFKAHRQHGCSKALASARLADLPLALASCESPAELHSPHAGQTSLKP